MGLVGAVVLLIGVGLAGLLVWFLGTYNGLVQKRQEVRKAWSQIDMQFKHRHGLIPNLVGAVKDYLAHERQTLENVMKARSQAVNATSVKGKVEAENLLTQTLRSLFAVAEQNPELRADQNVMALLQEATSTENCLSFARQFYNDQAMRLNAAVEAVPAKVVAALMGFQKTEFF